MFDGILIIDKPEGITSHDVVARCRRILKTKKIGHTGTLDPFATGVMVILVGKATRLAQFLDKDVKEYEALVSFGFETTTGDRTGQLQITNYELRNVSIDEIESILDEFRGEIWQTPPMFSAKKIEGKKLYELARKGIEIERKPVKVTIYELALEDEIRNPQSAIRIRVACSAGTYIRVLAEDIGKKLKIGAHLAELRRTKAGKFSIRKAVSLEELEKIVAANELEEISISMNDALSHLPETVLNDERIKKTKNGLSSRFENDELAENQAVRMIDKDNNLIAVGFYKKVDKIVQPKLVLV